MCKYLVLRVTINILISPNKIIKQVTWWSNSIKTLIKYQTSIKQALQKYTWINVSSGEHDFVTRDFESSIIQCSLKQDLIKTKNQCFCSQHQRMALSTGAQSVNVNHAKKPQVWNVFPVHPLTSLCAHTRKHKLDSVQWALCISIGAQQVPFVYMALIKCALMKEQKCQQWVPVLGMRGERDTPELLMLYRTDKQESVQLKHRRKMSSKLKWKYNGTN